jgi:hypothetical protein
MDSKGKKTLTFGFFVYIIIGLILTYSLFSMASEHEKNMEKFENYKSVLDWDVIVIFVLLLYFISGIVIIIWWTIYPRILKKIKP